MESTLPVVDSGVNRISASVSKSYHSVRFPTQLQSELLSRKLHTLQLSRTEPNRTTNSTLIAHKQHILQYDKLSHVSPLTFD